MPAIKLRSTFGATVTKYCCTRQSPQTTIGTGLECLRMMTVTYTLLVSKDLSHVEEAPADMGDWSTTVRDLSTAIDPVTLDLQLNLIAISRILKCDGTPTAHDREMTMNHKVMTIRAVAVE